MERGNAMKRKRKVKAQTQITTEESILLNMELLDLQEQFPERKMSMKEFLNHALRTGIENELAQIREKRRKEGMKC